MRLVWVAIIALGLAACGQPVRWQKVDGPYLIVAVDADDQTNVSYDLGDGGGAVGRIPSRVIAVSHNADFVTAEVRPSGEHAGAEFYYIIRRLDGVSVDPSVSVRGPLSATAFEQERSRLGLPLPKPID